MSQRTALYLRVSTLDQHPETQLYDLQALARQRGLERSSSNMKIGSAAPKRAALVWMNCWPTPAAVSSMLCWCGLAIDWPAASATSWRCWMN
jgi:hypothetical protein